MEPSHLLEQPLIDPHSELQGALKNNPALLFPPKPDALKPERRLAASSSTATSPHEDLEPQDDAQDLNKEEPQSTTKGNIVFSLFGQMLAAIVVLIAATRSTGLVAGVTLVFILVETAVTLAQIGERVWFCSTWTGTITPSKIVAFAMVCWWYIWACAFTFHKPFGPPTYLEEELVWKQHPHWAGFFGCWGGVMCATTTLVIVLHVKKPQDQHQIRNRQAQQVVPFILLTAIVQFIADLDKIFVTADLDKMYVTHPQDPGRFLYCWTLSAVTIVVSLAVMLVGHRIKSTWWKFGVWLFALLWTAVPLLVGLSGPFANEGKNGFWSAWVGCLLFLYWSAQMLVKKLHFSITWEV